MNKAKLKSIMRLTRGALALVLLASFLTAMAAQAVIQPGEPAPAFSKRTSAGSAFGLDQKTNDTVLLLFTKPDDKFTPDALRALEKMFDKTPELLKGMRVAVVLSRVENAAKVKAFEKLAAPKWPVIADSDDALYKSYRIIATPTIVIVSGKRTVAAIHAGYDLGLSEDVRAALAKARGLVLPKSMTGKTARPNMALQMGRRLAARGLWDEAAKYYAQAAKPGPLPPLAQLELAEINIELGNADAALALIAALPAELKEDGRAKKVETRAQEIKAGKTNPLKPPLVQR